MRHFIALFCSVLVCTRALQAANGSGESEPITTIVEREPVNTIEPVFRAYISIGTDKFTFIIPHHYHLCGDPERGVLKLNDLDSDSTITFTVVGPVPTDSSTLDASAYKEMVMKRHPEGKVTGEFSAVGLGKRGPAFDVDWKSETGLFRSTRTQFLPSIVGVLEISVTSSSKKFPEAQTTLNSMVRSLRSSVDGKLIVSRLADQS